MANWRYTSPRKLLEAHLSRPPNTRRAYLTDLEEFARFLGVSGPERAVKALVSMECGAALRVLESWKFHHRAGQLSLATTRRRVSSVLALLRLAHDYDVIRWMIHVRLPSAPAIRDTRGPSREAVERMLSLCLERGGPKGCRDRAIVCLLFFSALRAAEVLGLDLAHVDLPLRQVKVAPKGHWDRAGIPVAETTARALAAWIDRRGAHPGPLFTSLERSQGGTPGRLTYSGLHAMIRDLGRRVGVPCSPHGLRHAAASEINRLTGGNLSWGMALCRHRDPKTFMRYDDASGRNIRQATEILARGLHVRQPPEGTC